MMPTASAPCGSRVFARTGIPTMTGPCTKSSIAAMSRKSVNMAASDRTNRKPSPIEVQMLPPSLSSAARLLPSCSADFCTSGLNCRKASSREEMRKAPATTANASPTPAVSARAATVTRCSEGSTLLVPLNAAISAPASIGPTKPLDSVVVCVMTLA